MDSWSEAAQLTLLFVLASALSSVLVGAYVFDRWRRTCGTGSAKFVTVSASTNLYYKLDKIVDQAVTIIMPAGAGRYPLEQTEKLRAKWESRLGNWIARGATVKLLITLPSSDVVNYWQNLVDRFGSGLTVCVVDRSKASTSDAVEIGRLDTFHPTLVTRGDKRIGMWVENDHPTNSTIAYNVEFVAAEDIVDFQAKRFDRYFGVLNRLTGGGGNQLPFLTILAPSHGLQEIKKAS